MSVSAREPKVSLPREKQWGNSLWGGEINKLRKGQSSCRTCCRDHGLTRTVDGQGVCRKPPPTKRNLTANAVRRSQGKLKRPCSGSKEQGKNTREICAFSGRKRERRSSNFKRERREKLCVWGRNCQKTLHEAQNGPGPCWTT